MEWCHDKNFMTSFYQFWKSSPTEWKFTWYIVDIHIISMKTWPRLLKAIMTNYTRTYNWWLNQRADFFLSMIPNSGKPSFFRVCVFRLIWMLMQITNIRQTLLNIAVVTIRRRLHALCSCSHVPSSSSLLLTLCLQFPTQFQSWLH